MLGNSSVLEHYLEKVEKSRGLISKITNNEILTTN